MDCREQVAIRTVVHHDAVVSPVSHVRVANDCRSHTVHTHHPTALADTVGNLVQWTPKVIKPSVTYYRLNPPPQEASPACRLEGEGLGDEEGEEHGHLRE